MSELAKTAPSHSYELQSEKIVKKVQRSFHYFSKPPYNDIWAFSKACTTLKQRIDYDPVSNVNEI